MIDLELLEAIGKVVGALAVAAFAAWSKVDSARAKRTAEDAKQHAAQVDREVNVIDLGKGDRARTIEKFIDIERRLKQLEDALTVLLKGDN